MAPEYFKKNERKIQKLQDMVLIMQEGDIWSFGITLYCLIYRKLPFYDENAMKLFDQIQNKKIAYPKQPPISKQLTSLLKNMLNRNPRKRIKLADIIKDKWINQNNQPLKQVIE